MALTYGEVSKSIDVKQWSVYIAELGGYDNYGNMDDELTTAQYSAISIPAITDTPTYLNGKYANGLVKIGEFEDDSIDFNINGGEITQGQRSGDYQEDYTQELNAIFTKTNIANLQALENLVDKYIDIVLIDERKDASVSLDMCRIYRRVKLHYNDSLMDNEVVKANFSCTQTGNSKEFLMANVDITYI